METEKNLQKHTQKNTNVIQKGNPILRQIAMDVPIADIASPEIKKVIKKMKEALTEEDDAVAIAAPQIGESIRIFVISGRVIWYIKNEEEVPPPAKYPDDQIFINPKILKLSKEKFSIFIVCFNCSFFGSTYFPI